MKKQEIKLTQTELIIIVCLFLTPFYNYAFTMQTVDAFPFVLSNMAFFASLFFVITSLNIFLSTVVSNHYTLKGMFILIFLVTSMTSYFTNSYGVVMDKNMIRNLVQTDMHESLDLLSVKQVVYFIVFGLIPSFFVYRVKLVKREFKKEIVAKLKLGIFSLLFLAANIFAFSQHYTSFFREFGELRTYINPTYWIYNSVAYVWSTDYTNVVAAPIEDDAKIADTNSSKKLLIMVVGEAARADHFSLNGYKRETNPLLKKEDIINFSDYSSCGTSTAYSVPCMFSIFGRSDYDYAKGISNENVLDVLNHTDRVSILWRDNNSNSKGVALRVPYEDYKYDTINSICENGECRDEGMLVGLDEYIEKHSDKNILIILHQMGNHGPAYYKRYPEEFLKFKPVCQTSQLEECSQESIKNAYDNALLYTDYFLSKTINLLKKYDGEFETGLIYMSDHGESLGEHGVYLHGLPYSIAPDAQTRVASIMWLGKKSQKSFDVESLKKRSDKSYSQDNLFHTLLGFFGVETKVYDSSLDILKR